jgi:hypothetical protein
MAKINRYQKYMVDVGSHGMYFSDNNGQIALQCPHCSRWLMVDIDDYLPVHDRRSAIRVANETPPQEELSSLCDGSYNTKGVKGKGKAE